MKNWRCSPLLAVVAALSGPLVCSEDIQLYPFPEAAGEPIATVPADDIRLEHRGPVVDAAAAAEGWQWAEFDGDFVGYVPDAKIGKDLYPVAGALIHALPDIDSAVLATVTEEDLHTHAIEITDRGPWWTVAFSKPIPVYFREPVVRGAAAIPLAEEDDPESVPETELPAHESASPSARQPATPVAPPVFGDDDPLVAPAPGAQSVAGSLGATFRGTLRRAGARFFVLRPPYPYELLDRNGQRLAYVDLEDAVLSQPPSAFLDRQVSVYGPWETIGDSRTIVVRVRNLNVLPSR